MYGVVRGAFASKAIDDEFREAMGRQEASRAGKSDNVPRFSARSGAARSESERLENERNAVFDRDVWMHERARESIMGVISAKFARFER